MENPGRREVTVHPRNGLQFGHGGEPWRTVGGLKVQLKLLAELQFGHGGEPWRTLDGLPALVRQHDGFNSATAVNRGEPR